MKRGNVLIQWDSVNQLHHEKGLRARFHNRVAAFINMRNSGMLQSSQRLHFDFKSTQDFVRYLIGPNQFQRHASTGVGL